MPPSRTLVCIEWDAARRHDRPNDRKTITRIFRSPDIAARQYAALLPWLGSHIEIVGVWAPVGYDDRGVVWAPFHGPAHLQPLVPDRDEVFV